MSHNERPHVISVAILAMGGEGGGVLADWLVDLAEHNGYLAQTTSVPGVAQRTGATIYYVELYPQAAVPAGAEPVLALLPFPGRVDLVLASELMEAGRALQRGLVTRERTTLITSTHRVYSMTEKTAMADGRVDEAKLIDGARAAARELVALNFSEIAERHGTPIGPALLGAVAARGGLPFTRAQFEAAIERGGIGVKASLRAFAAGFDAVQQGAPSASDTARAPAGVGPRLQALAARAERDFAPSAQHHLRLGLTRLVDYQDEAYAAWYLDRLQALQQAAGHTPAHETLVAEAARHLALWMSYEDVVRVADLKTRDTRFARVRQEMHLPANQVLHLHEFLHPRVEEIADTLPAGLGRWLLARPALRGWLERRLHKGRLVQTTSLRGFLQLYLLAGLRRWRRGSLRYATEQARIEDWLSRVTVHASQRPDLALQIVRLQQLIKGYSDTHQRGWRHFSAILAMVDTLAAHPDAAQRLQALREAALADEEGRALEVALQTQRNAPLPSHALQHT